MRLHLLGLAIVILAAHSARAQTVTQTPLDAEATVERNSLFFELRALDAEAAELRKPLARARAKVEIADAAWSLDMEWA